MRYLIQYFIRFKKFVGRRVYYLLAFMMVVGFVEGIGITLFLPVLQNGFSDDKLSKALSSVFDLLHISFSFTLVLSFIFVFFIFRAILLISYARYLGKISSNLIIALRRKVLEGVFSADYIYLLKKEMGYISNVIIREITGVVDAFSNFASTLSYTIYGFVYIALAMLLNFRVVIILMALSPALFILIRRFNSLINQASRDTSFVYGKFHSVLIQALSKLKYLKATLSDVKISRIIDRQNKKLGNLGFRLFFLQSLSRLIFEPFVVFAVVGILFYYVVILQRGVNEVIFLAFLFLQVARQLLNAQGSYRKFLASIGCIETLNNFLKELEENKEGLNLGKVPPDFEKNVIFKDVTLIFPNGKKALDNVNISIKPRSIVAFVGHSGSGKSTVANMITGILKPTKGEIVFGDTGYDRINLKNLRENIGYITQEDIIFNASIKDNVSLWSEDINEDRLARVIEIAHITGFVNDLAEKQDSMLGDNGLDISGGQRQRVTIARELYKDTKLLILDEATSSLDSKAEKQIYENLKEFKGSKTMIVIAHRLSTIKNADYIYVLDEGKVMEEGTYEELYQKRGEFKRMIDDQKLV